MLTLHQHDTVVVRREGVVRRIVKGRRSNKDQLAVVSKRCVERVLKGLAVSAQLQLVLEQVHRAVGVDQPKLQRLRRNRDAHKHKDVDRDPVTLHAEARGRLRNVAYASEGDRKLSNEILGYTLNVRSSEVATREGHGELYVIEVQNEEVRVGPTICFAGSALLYELTLEATFQHAGAS